MSLRKINEPITYQMFVLALIFGVPLLMIYAKIFGISFPISDARTALWMIPKVAGNSVCLEGFMARAAINIYAVSYANLTVWLGAIGLYAGLTASKVFVFREVKKLNAVVAADPNDVGVGEKGGRDKIPVGLLGVGLVGGFMVLSWWEGFRRTACARLQTGYPLYRAFDGILPSIFALFFFFAVGFLLERLYSQLRNDNHS